MESAGEATDGMEKSSHKSNDKNTESPTLLSKSRPGDYSSSIAGCIPQIGGIQLSPSYSERRLSTECSPVNLGYREATDLEPNLRMTPEDVQASLEECDRSPGVTHPKAPCRDGGKKSRDTNKCKTTSTMSNPFLEKRCVSSAGPLRSDSVQQQFSSTSLISAPIPTSSPHGPPPSASSLSMDPVDFSDCSSQSDVETFTGKIVYNPDGSAYIIEGAGAADSEFSDDECSLDLPQQEGSIVDARGMSPPEQFRVFPQVVNAFHICRNPAAIYGALYGQAYSLLQEKKVPDIPIMHSYRVFNIREKQNSSSSPSLTPDAVGDHMQSPCEEGKENSAVSSNRRPSSSGSGGGKANFATLQDYGSVPIKPILMCFICKLSFGYTKSFIAHAMGEHNLSLNDEERHIMAQKNTSAIIQGVGKEKDPLLSFLEPVAANPAPYLGSTDGVSLGHQKLSEAFFGQPPVHSSCTSSSFAPSDSAVTSLLNAVGKAVSSALGVNPSSSTSSMAVTTLVSASSSPVSSVPEIKPFGSLVDSMSVPVRVRSDDDEALAPELEDLANLEKMAKAAAAAAAAEANGSLRASPNGSCNADRVGTPRNGTCVNTLRANCLAVGQVEDTRRSPFSSSAPPTPNSHAGSLERPTSAGSSGSLSPGIRGSPKILTSPSSLPPCQSPNTSAVNVPETTQLSLGMLGSPPGLMITGCAQHPDGKTNGVECPKCEMVLGSSRSLGGHMTMMHSRNSCKTLKCPKCNWHYKYQETLEIHMKEKHPENEMNCIYCLTNQPHPRLARGETYTCGYKPYRCEVCNYSTTTKGNLSIHMQSDKHINNVQELQNGTLNAADHILNTQPLGPAGPMAAPPPGPDPNKKPAGPPASKPKATWRCDVCNYETNVARNLRIHMTSEKHTHNMMVLQQNVKHMQQLSALQQAQAQSLDPLFQFHPGLLLPCDSQLQPEAALADMAYNHALLMMASQQHQQRAIAAAAAAASMAQTKGGMPSPMNLTTASSPCTPTVDIEHPDPTFRPDTPYDEDGKLFQCCVCNAFSADTVEGLNMHLQQDRTRQREEEVLMAVAGSYICKLCTYKTNLKANFQLHCKTDKHLQRLQQVNHIKEGGTRNDWKLKYLNVSNPVQVRCNSCDYYTNSIHKLQLHAADPRHEVSAQLYLHLGAAEGLLKPEAAKYYHCKLCNFATRSKINLIKHFHSLRHLRNENVRQMQRKAEGRGPNDEDDLRDLFAVAEYTGNEKIIFDADVDIQLSDMKELEPIKSEEQSMSALSSPKPNEAKSPGGVSASVAASMLKQALLDPTKSSPSTPAPESNGDPLHACPFCNYTSSSEVRIQMHVVSQHSRRPARVSCPLCQERFKEFNKLENHLMEVHSVNQEGVQRLMMMVDQSEWVQTDGEGHDQPKTSPAESVASSSSSSSSQLDENLATDLMKDDPMDVDHKLMPDGDLAMRLEKFTGEEIAPEEFCCPICAQIFVAVDELFAHQNEQGHLELKQTPRGMGFLCWKKGCNQYFKTSQALQIHFREIHAKKPQLSVSEKHVYKYRCNQCSLAFKTLEKLQLHSQYHLIRAATKCVLCARSFRTVSALQKHVETSHTDMSKDEIEQYRLSLVNNPLLAASGGGVLDPLTTELLKKESNRDEVEPMDDIENNNMEDSTPDNDCGGENNNSDRTPPREANYKDQQFLEDYINSQAIAEDTYNDPTRKYKCHRCKVAFTRQSYLTSHNKTLLHRKGEKLSYPMEKYLDPNRPYKCEICKESFTQKNILLVHYNSVSHLHKLKQSMKDSSSNTNAANNSMTVNNNLINSSSIALSIATGSSSTPSPVETSIRSPTPPTGTPTPTTSSSASSTQASSSDSDKKPFKCNICKVAYSQGPTLDIHMRSVLHQTRASKLPELAMTGQVDLSAPLIERPDPIQTPEQKPFLDLSSSNAKFMPPTTQVSSPVNSIAACQPTKLDLSQVPLGTNVPVSSASPKNAPSTLQQQQENVAVAATSLQQSLSMHPGFVQSQVSPPQAVFSCQRCSAAFVSQEALVQHQQFYCFFSQPPVSVATAASLMNAAVSSAASLQQSTTTTTQVHSGVGPCLSLASQNQQIADELSKQNNQAVAAAVAAEIASNQALAVNNANQLQTAAQLSQQLLRAKCHFARCKPPMYKHLLESYGFELVMQFNENHQRRPRKDAGEKKEKTDTLVIKEEGKSTEETNAISTQNKEPQQPVDPDLPEINRSVCNVCQKEFTSIWVLKAHKEEIHREVVPFEFLHKYADYYRQEYEKNNHSQQQQQVALALQQQNEEMASLAEANLAQAEQLIVPGTTAPSVGTSTVVTTSPPTVSSGNSPTPPATSMANQSNQDAASSMTANQMAAQLQFNQLLMSMGLGMGLPMGMNVPFAAAMNMHPPLMMMPPPFDPIMASAFNHPMMGNPNADPAFFANQQKMMQQQQQQQQQNQLAAAAAAAAHAQQQQKRARTRISDEQLKILRTYFDINNSPTEEQLIEMSEKSGLPLKVIKHWFRNTLFKERQRNKDSPYNFNNPPSTFLNLEEYEKTGEAKVVNICNEEKDDNSTKMSVDDVPPPPKMEEPPQLQALNLNNNQRMEDYKINDDIEPKYEIDEKNEVSLPQCSNFSSNSNSSDTFVSEPSSGSTFSKVTNSLIHSLSMSDFGLKPAMVSEPSSPLLLNSSSMALMTHQGATPPSSDSPKASMANTATTPTSSSGSNSGKRANRTRFTDYQIKVLQEFFETNAYPKDDDLEYLSKLLNLSPRVIVVWFQNARQKARKVYENQPPLTPEDESSGRFQRTPGLNYQCKKCLQVFQRYYELIKHQKSACFKDENPLALQMKSNPQSSNEERTPTPVAPTTPTPPRQQPQQQQQTQQQQQQTQQQQQQQPNQQQQQQQLQQQQQQTSQETKFAAAAQQNGSYRCDKCSLVFPRFDLWREHQIVHIMNPNLFPNYPPNSSFGILQYEAQQSPVAAVKRKLPEEEDSKDSLETPKDKRLRTTILPEQLDFLYQKYQIESNPSRKMLENIAREVGLKKRVVQVWFQNTRARERKGQFRAHQQVIHKRCPFCRALFKARSALESHLATRHADQYTKGDINIDALPDGDDSNQDGTSMPTNGGNDENKNTSPGFLNILAASSSASPTVANLSSANIDLMHNTMKKYYEDSLKKYLDELTIPNMSNKEGGPSIPTDLSVKAIAYHIKTEGGGKQESTGAGASGDTPLDLSRPVKVNIDSERNNDCISTILSDRSYEEGYSLGASMDDLRSDSHSENSTDNLDMDDGMSRESNPTSPAPGSQAGSLVLSRAGSHHRSLTSSGKRFRTQMTTVQLKAMKSIFSEYKTPSMAECEMLGREIGLPKRVVQVWFQNARAKEKKSKLAFAKTFGQELEPPKPPEECKICNVKYNLKYSNTSMQDHIFSRRHIDNLRNHIDNMKKLTDGHESSSSVDKMEYTTSTPSGGNGSTPTPSFLQLPQLQGSQQSTTTEQQPERSKTSPATAAAMAAAAGQNSLMQQLQMMGLQQMAGLPVALTNFSQSSATSTDANKNDNGGNGTSADSVAAANNISPSTSVAGSVTPSTGSSPETKMTAKVKEEKKDSPTSASAQPGTIAQGNALLGALGDFPIPTSEAAGLFPYMYAGFPGYYAGMPGAFLHPTMYTGRNNL